MNVPIEKFDRLPTEEEAALAEIAVMAKTIKNEKHLRKILLDAHLGLRLGVYNQLVPYLTFTPRAYRKLMRHA